ncbi:MAG: hypothetical protein WCJ64_20490 [Rhodospirillaceae bacterium]
MAKRFLILMLALGLSAAAPAVRAQTPAAAPAERNDIDRFAAEYTRTVILGVVAGGVLMNTLIGGGRATLAGALAGSSLASWLFVSLQARHYVIQRAAPHQSR